MDANRALLLIALGGLLLLGGCAGPGPRPAGRLDSLKPDRIIALATGETLTLPRLVERLLRAEVVFIGEYHEHPRQHVHQLELIQNLFALDRRLVIGLEVFARPQQELLDQWVAGSMGEDEFTARVLGSLLSPEAFAVYLPLLQWTRENGVPLLALNAPHGLAAQVAERGLSSLTGDDRRWAAREIELGPPAYRARVLQAFKHHRPGLNPDNFFAAQVLWDETMAETLTDYLTSARGRGRRAVVICGNEHVWSGYGLPDRVARRFSGGQARLIAPLATEDETLTPAVADYAWVTAPAPSGRRARLGVELSAGPAGTVSIGRVAPGSEAESLGLRPGDRLLELDGRPIKSALDLHQAVMVNGSAREHLLTVDRDGTILKFKFKFREQPNNK
ncbi:MAG: ChaN family lipoprotein [Thermodesulfobacteriota bacterium]